jgi:hypothetical protein
MGSIHLKGLTYQARDALTQIGGRDTLHLEGEQGYLLQEAIHQDQQDLSFRGKVLIKAAHRDPCPACNLLNRGLLITLLRKERQR